jgi:hypothetical protein
MAFFWRKSAKVTAGYAALPHRFADAIAIKAQSAKHRASIEALAWRFSGEKAPRCGAI